MQEIHVTENEAGQRLDKLLVKFLKDAPRSFLYKMLRKKNIVLNGKKASGSEKLVRGDVVKLFLSEETIEKFSGGKKDMFREDGDSMQFHDMPQILYENPHILLLNKPVGMLSQKAGESDISAVEYVIRYLLESGQLSVQDLRTFRPSVCNRLDRNTSGILAAGKSLAGLQELSRFFRERTIGKYYLCLVHGSISASESVRGYLCKDTRTNRVQVRETEQPGSVAIETEYRPLSCNGSITLLEVHLITGKTHQIRAHLAASGYPILGDYKYGNHRINQGYREQYGLESQLLHAWRIRFPKSSGVLGSLSGKEFTAPPPAVFQTICERSVLQWPHGIPGD